METGGKLLRYASGISQQLLQVKPLKPVDSRSEKSSIYPRTWTAKPNSTFIVQLEDKKDSGVDFVDTRWSSSDESIAKIVSFKNDIAEIEVFNSGEAKIHTQGHNFIHSFMLKVPEENDGSEGEIKITGNSNVSPGKEYSYVLTNYTGDITTLKWKMVIPNMIGYLIGVKEKAPLKVKADAKIGDSGTIQVYNGKQLIAEKKVTVVIPTEQPNKNKNGLLLFTVGGHPFEIVLSAICGDSVSISDGWEAESGHTAIVINPTHDCCDQYKGTGLSLATVLMRIGYAGAAHLLSIGKIKQNQFGAIADEFILKIKSFSLEKKKE